MKPCMRRLAIRVGSISVILAFVVIAAVGAQGALARDDAAGQASSAAIGDVPNPPSNVAVLALNSNQIRVTWKDNSTNEDKFVIYDGTNVWDFVPPNQTTYVANGLQAGSFHCYRVTAYSNTYGESDKSTSACTSTPLSAPPPGPLAPSNLLAAPTSTTQIRLTWLDNSSNETGFYIYEEGSADPPKTVGSNVTTYSATVTPGSSHCYHVTAYNAQGESVPSGSDCAQTPLTPPVGAPNAPTGVTATAVSATQIRVTWLDNSTNEKGFKIYDSGKMWTVGADITTYTVGDLAPGSPHCFQVSSFNDYDESTAPGLVCTSTLSGPSAPTNLAASALSTSQIKLTWTDTSGDETGFKVLEGTTTVATASANATTATVSNLAAGSNHCYVVVATNAVGDSQPSNQACATTQSGSASKAPSAPGSLVATAISTSQIKLTWTDTSSNETGFRIYEGSQQVGTVGAGVTTYTRISLQPNTYHCFQVAAYNSYGASGMSNQACATTLSSSTGTKPATPTNVAASALSTSRIRITWTDASTNETGFKVYEGGVALVGTVGAGVTTFTATGMTAATYHCYTVVAYNGAGESAPSTQICTMTRSFPDDLIVTSPLTLTPSVPMRGQTVTAQFTVQNKGQVEMVVLDLAAAARIGTDFTGVNVDFPHVTNLRLQPGQSYTYRQTRSFTTAGAYFVEQTTQLQTGAGIYPTNRITFTIY